MTTISFTTQDAPDNWIRLDVDVDYNFDKYNLINEHDLATRIFNHYPNLKKANRRIKNLSIKDWKGDIYETDDFDIPGSLIKKEK